MAKFELTTAQRAVVDNRGGTLLVSAAAGSGKTAVLVDRVLRQVSEGHQMDEFLLITFTQAAASELRGKLIAALSERLADEPNNSHLQRQLSRVYLTQISTVHAFCGVLLREYAHTLDLSGDFRILDDNEAGLLRQKAMDTVLHQVYGTLDDDREIFSALELFGEGRSDKDLPVLIERIYEILQCRRDPREAAEKLATSLSIDGCDDLGQTVWGEYLLEEFRSCLQGHLSQLRSGIETAAAHESLTPYLAVLQQDLSVAEALLAAQDWRAVGAVTLDFARSPSIRRCDVPELRERLKKLRTTVRDEIRELHKVFLLPTGQTFEDLRVTGEAIRGLLKLVDRFSHAYQDLKHRRRTLDYNDLEHQALRLLVAKNGEPTAAAREIGARYVEVMVDEYQDTNAVQDAIFQAIAYRGNLFMVGDVKQSIYRFRMADPQGFLRRYRSYADYRQAQEGEPRKILLSDNFRSAPEILSAANDVFRLLMSERVGGLKYGEAEALRPNQAPQGGRPVELHCIDASAFTEELRFGKDDAEAEFVARRIEQMLGGETITLNNEARPIRPEDITILMRGVHNRAEYYIDALRRHGISCVCGSENVLETQEITVLTALLKLLDNPHQDIALLAVLFSPLFRFTADDLAQLRAKHRDSDLFDALCADERGRPFVQTIGRLRDIAAGESLHNLFNEIDEMLHLQAIYAGCESSFDTFAHLIDSYETGDRFGLSGFLRQLELQKQKGLSVEQGAQKGAVRILTMHKSKGLEFPVVFLVGLSRKFNDNDLSKEILVDPELGIGAKRFDPERAVEYPTPAIQAIASRMKRENRSEEMRILYVAMTRAKCRLVMTCCSRSIQSTLKKIREKMTTPPSEAFVGNASSMGQWLLMAAMTRTEGGVLFGGEEGLAERRVSEYPWKITMSSGLDFLPRAVASAEDVGQTAQTAIGFRRVEYPHRAACLTPSKATATQLKGRALDEELEKMPKLHFPKPNFSQKASLSPTERGTAVHLAMQFLRYDRCTEEASLQQELSRLVTEKRLRPEQAEAVALEPILRLFRGDLGRRILRAKKLLREFKFSVLEDGSTVSPELAGEKILLQGIADCCLVEDDGICIIDFKTDRIESGGEAERAEHYRPQLEAYSRALSRIFGLPVKERILYFFATGQAWTPEGDTK